MPQQPLRSAAPAPTANKPVKRVEATPALLMAKLPVLEPKARFSLGVGVGIGISIVAHAFVLLGLGIAMPDGGARKEKPHLDVVLVNAKHSHAPRQVQALAQANMEGGGNVDTKDLPTTPLPPEHIEQTGDALTDETKRVESLEARARALLAQEKAMATVEQAINRRTDEQAPNDAPKPGSALADRMRAASKKEAAIEKDLRDYASRPRKTFVSPNTKESEFALYTIAWRKVVEDLGSLKFPKDSSGNPLYGSVMLSIEIDRKGRLTDSSVERSSGSKKLDEAALRIVRMASPFKPLPPETARDTDILVLVETFRFQKVLGDSTLEVKNSTQ
jgi:protein TonB